MLASGKATLGHVPKHDLAGSEYIRQWFKEVMGQPFEIDQNLPDDVKNVVEKTLNSARESWWRYPSKEEADKSEDIIQRYSKASYKVNLEEVWPLYKELVEKDMKNQELEEFLKDLKDKMKAEEGQSEQGEGQDSESKKEKATENMSNLSESEKQAIEEAIKDSINNDINQAQKNEDQEGKKGSQNQSPQSTNNPIDLDKLPESVKEKIKEFIESLPKDDQKKLRDRAEKALKDFDKTVEQMLQGKFDQDKKIDKEGDTKMEVPKDLPTEISDKKMDPKDKKEIEEMRKEMKKLLNTHESVYKEIMQEVLPVIDELENDLREIFVARRAKKWETGFKTGRKIDMKKRIQEKAKNVDVFESRAWQKREHPDEKDYAITLLVDLSGSMEGEKIQETFKAVVVLQKFSTSFPLILRLLDLTIVCTRIKNLVKTLMMRFDQTWEICWMR
jgi:hypothetical protein